MVWPLNPASCQYADSTPAVMNYTEMEAKVREATNNEPWVRSQCGTITAHLEGQCGAGYLGMIYAENIQ